MANYTTSLPDHELFNENSDDFWVFAYGSLMWHPDFEYVDRRLATLEGYHRALCIYSWVHRGTKEKPGLVFGLDVGGVCQGVAYKIPVNTQRSTVGMLRARELVTSVYQEVKTTFSLDDDNQKTVEGLCYTAVLDHEQYAGALSHADTLRYVKQGVGGSGINTEYVLNTYDHLREQGVRDDALAALCRDLRA